MRLDKVLAYLFIIGLYLQLLFGVILFSNLSLSMGYDYQSADGSMVVVSKRLWPVEHIVLMLFALFIANLGLIFSSKSNIDTIKHKKILLIIDEAQKLSHEMLDELRLLSNLKKNDAKLLDIVLSGQNELNETLSEPQNRAVLQRITTKYTIEPLKKVEVTYYIEFRLSVAGSKKNIFNSDAIQKIILFSKCYPRLINIICDNALLAGYMAKLKIIDGSIIQECANNLQLSELSAEKEQNENEVFGSGSNARFKPTCNTSF